MNLVWSAKFTRAFKRVVGSDEKLLSEVKGELAGTWSCSVNYDLRILFDFVKNSKTDELEILLLAIGTHDEVY